MHGLVDVDVTEARRLLDCHEPPLSMTAFVIAVTARAVASHPEVHAYRDWRGRLLRHRHVQTLVEIQTGQGPFGLVHVVRDADIRNVEDISAELRRVKADPSSTPSGRALRRLARWPGGSRQAMEEESRIVGSTMKPAWNGRSVRGTLGACVTAPCHEGPESGRAHAPERQERMYVPPRPRAP